jgi:hypothetical protein
MREMPNEYANSACQFEERLSWGRESLKQLVILNPDVRSDAAAYCALIDLMAVALNAVAAMRGGTKEGFMEMAKEAAEEYLNGDDEEDA